MVPENLKSIRQRIARCCERVGRYPEDVALVCVTKEASVDQIEEALGLGVSVIAENRIQDALVKYKTIGDRATWHLVGHLQTNKVRDAVRMFSLIHSLDSIHLSDAINKEAAKIKKIQDVLVQVNVSGEKTKFGVSANDALDFLNKLSLYGNINVKGLMTIAPEVDDTQEVRPYFRALRELKDKVNSILNTQYSILSMGMTNDFEVAIEEGSTMVRIGRAIFG